MKSQDIVAAIASKKGQHVQVVWQRDAKTKKGTAFRIEKRTCAWVRSGIDYSNLASVKAGIAAGERDEVQSLPDWCEWETFPFILRHKANGTEYVRLYPATLHNLQTPKVEWVMDGVVSTYADCEPYLLASEKTKDEDEKPACFSVKSDSILEIAGE